MADAEKASDPAVFIFFISVSIQEHYYALRTQYAATTNEVPWPTNFQGFLDRLD